MAQRSVEKHNGRRGETAPAGPPPPPLPPTTTAPTNSESVPTGPPRLPGGPVQNVDPMQFMNQLFGGLPNSDLPGASLSRMSVNISSGPALHQPGVSSATDSGNERRVSFQKNPTRPGHNQSKGRASKGKHATTALGPNNAREPRHVPVHEDDPDSAAKVGKVAADSILSRMGKVIQKKATRKVLLAPNGRAVLSDEPVVGQPTLRDAAGREDRNRSARDKALPQADALVEAFCEGRGVHPPPRPPPKLARSPSNRSSSSNLYGLGRGSGSNASLVSNASSRISLGQGFEDMKSRGNYAITKRFIRSVPEALAPQHVVRSGKHALQAFTGALSGFPLMKQEAQRRGKMQGNMFIRGVEQRLQGSLPARMSHPSPLPTGLVPGDVEYHQS